MLPSAQWAIIEAMDHDLTTSTARDVAAGRPSELDAISGSVVRAGADWELPARRSPSSTPRRPPTRRRLPRRAVDHLPEKPPRAVAFVPARSGSERVPGKNVRPLAGHPLLAYAIETALQSGVFERVVVSTDSEEIADVARWYGADVPFLRPAEYATSTSPGHRVAPLHARAPRRARTSSSRSSARRTRFAGRTPCAVGSSSSSRRPRPTRSAPSSS